MKKSVDDVTFVHGFFVLSKSDTESTVAGFRWCPKVVCKRQSSYYCGEKSNKWYYRKKTCKILCSLSLLSG